jgi:hypothetical protein
MHSVHIIFSFFSSSSFIFPHVKPHQVTVLLLLNRHRRRAPLLPSGLLASLALQVTDAPLRSVSMLQRCPAQRIKSTFIRHHSFDAPEMSRTMNQIDIHLSPPPVAPLPRIAASHQPVGTKGADSPVLSSLEVLPTPFFVFFTVLPPCQPLRALHPFPDSVQ